MNTKKFIKKEIKAIKSSIKWDKEYLKKKEEKLVMLEKMLRE